VEQTTKIKGKNPNGTDCEDTWTSYLLDYRYQKIPNRWLPEDGSLCTGAERSKYFMDKSYLLHHLVKTRYGSWNELIGEFQFSFIAFWLAESYESFEHWKDMMMMLCYCEASIEENTEEWKKLLETIEKQMMVVPEDFFVDILSCKNFLEPCLKNLFENLESSNSSSIICESFSKLRNTVEQRFKKSFSPSIEFDSSDEDAPVVVMLD